MPRRIEGALLPVEAVFTAHVSTACLRLVTIWQQLHVMAGRRDIKPLDTSLIPYSITRALTQAQPRTTAVEKTTAKLLNERGNLTSGP